MSVPPSIRILCVDDDYDSCELIRFILVKENKNYDVITASSADEAVRLINNESFDLYILDYCLPAMSGIQLCRRIRETDLKTPVLFYSAMGRKIDREIAKKAGANIYLTKPNDFEKLSKSVRQLLNNDG
jgi:DNA-binding response OmpR family regulator